MADIVNVGNNPDDGTGDKLRDAFIKINEAFNNMVGAPSYTDPTTDINLSNMTLEIGSSNVRTITNSFIQNDAGVLVSQRIYKNSIEVSDTGSYDETGVVAPGGTVYRGQVTYEEGPIKNNDIGIPDGRGKIEAGTINTSNRTINGILPYYWKEFDVMPDLDSLNISDFNKVVSSSNGKITLTMDIVSKHLVILIPNGSTTKTKWEITPLNAGDIGTGELILSPVIKTISSHQGYWSSEDYKVYVTAYITSISPKIDLID